MKKTLLFMLTGIVFLATACATTGGSSGTSGSRDVITHEQMLEANAQTAYDAVQRLQTGWLTGRGPGVVPNVYVNGSRSGDVEYLRSLRTEDVAEIRHYSSSEAGARFGMGNEGGVIAVTLR